MKLQTLNLVTAGSVNLGSRKSGHVGHGHRMRVEAQSRVHKHGKRDDMVTIFLHGNVWSGTAALPNTSCSRAQKLMRDDID
jgi:hypothetical protein